MQLPAPVPMPLVTVGSITVEYQLGLVKDGAIQHLAGYLPGDDDSPIPTIFKDLQPGSKVNKSGLNLTAFPVVPNGTLPQKFANGRVKLHLCTTETCTAGRTGAVHLGEWAYREEGEEVDGGPLLRLLVAANVKGTVLPKSPVPDPKSKAKAVQFEMDGQSPATPKTTPAGPITSWCNTSGIPEVAEALAFNGVRAVDEVALMTDAQIEMLCKPLNLGSELRMKKAVTKLREKDQPATSPEPGSGWFEVHTGKEVPLSAMRGSDALVAEGKGVAFVKLSGRWVELHKPATSGPRTSHEAPELACENGPTQVFRRAGPLEELTSSARTLLRQVGGPGAVPTDLAEHDEPLASQLQATHQNGAHPGMSPMRWSRPYPTPDTVPRTTGAGCSPKQGRARWRCRLRSRCRAFRRHRSRRTGPTAGTCRFVRRCGRPAGRRRRTRTWPTAWRATSTWRRSPARSSHRSRRRRFSSGTWPRSGGPTSTPRIRRRRSISGRAPALVGVLRRTCGGKRASSASFRRASSPIRRAVCFRSGFFRGWRRAAAGASW